MSYLIWIILHVCVCGSFLWSCVWLKCIVNLTALPFSLSPSPFISSLLCDLTNQTKRCHWHKVCHKFWLSLQHWRLHPSYWSNCSCREHWYSVHLLYLRQCQASQGAHRRAQGGQSVHQPKALRDAANSQDNDASKMWEYTHVYGGHYLEWIFIASVSLLL